MSESLAPLDGTVSQRIRLVRNRLAPAELAVANALSENYPMSGLIPIVQLAASAGASAPTVVRFVRKMGFDSYSDFQDALRQEAQNRLFSPLDSYPDTRSTIDETSPATQAQAVYFESIRNTFSALDPQELAVAVAAIVDINRPLLIAGGRFSEVLALQLFRYLTILRPNVRMVATDIHSLIDVSPSTIAIVFDFRRYQQSTINWGIEAINKGASIILVTDQYLSPLASRAMSLLTTSTKGLEPFDSMTAAFALTELLISEVARERGEAARDRLAEFVRRQDDEDRIALRAEPPPKP